MKSRTIGKIIEICRTQKLRLTSQTLSLINFTIGFLTLAKNTTWPDIQVAKK
jgi:hypothetical protein